MDIWVNKRGNWPTGLKVKDQLKGKRKKRSDAFRWKNFSRLNRKVDWILILSQMLKPFSWHSFLFFLILFPSSFLFFFLFLTLCASLSFILNTSFTFTFFYFYPVECFKILLSIFNFLHYVLLLSTITKSKKRKRVSFIQLLIVAIQCFFFATHLPSAA